MNQSRGMSLVDVIVGSALMLIVFLALLGLLRTSLLLASAAKAKAGATTVASTQVEYLRSLSYDAVGTEGGIPAGPVPQLATTTLNGVPYQVRTLVQYVDDPADGTGGADANGITTDYKRVRVSAAYLFRGAEREVVLVSNVAPRAMETNAGGGTLRIAVVDAAGAGVSGAAVRIENPSLSPSVGVTVFTDLTGSVALPGAPASGDYRIIVSKGGHSSAQTYVRDESNQNPTPGYLTVAEGQTTTGTFAIDLLSLLTVRTFSPVRPAESFDTFDDAEGVASASDVVVDAGSLTLAGAPGAYAPAGDIEGALVAPEYLNAWDSVFAEASVPSGTMLRLQVSDSAGNLLPDSVLAGNGAGFASFPIDISSVATTTYPSLSLRAELSTSVPSIAPRIDSWTVAFDEGPVPLPGVAFTLTGGKRIGTTGDGTPLPKTVVSSSTDENGIAELSLEWDIYELLVPEYAILSASSTAPYALSPGQPFLSELILE